MSVLLCLSILASAAHVSGRSLQVKDALWTGGAFLIALALTLFLTVSPELIAVTVAGAAVWRLVQGVSTVVASIFAGAMAGLAVGLYEDAGAPLWLALIVVLGVTMLAAWVTRAAGAEMTRIRDGVLLAVAWTAPVVAVAPGVLAGWGSAGALNQTSEQLSTGIPLWTGLLTVAALLAGGFVGYWKRR